MHAHKHRGGAQHMRQRGGAIDNKRDTSGDKRAMRDKDVCRMSLFHAVSFEEKLPGVLTIAECFSTLLSLSLFARTTEAVLEPSLAVDARWIALANGSSAIWPGDFGRAWLCFQSIGHVLVARQLV